MLNKKLKYLQISINSNKEKALKIISELPKDERIILEAGTPFLKRYGIEGLNFFEKILERIFSG
ncbi:MAG: hypothetical protein NZ866_02990 [Patescibacteria group bacterium]|nr:hypothetical protein [Patescibacteria group bacterium]